MSDIDNNQDALAAGSDYPEEELYSSEELSPNSETLEDIQPF